MKPTLIALAASPNKEGNSDTLLEAFLEGVKSERPDLEIKKTYLYDLDCAPFAYKTKVPLDTETLFAVLCKDLSTGSGLIIATPTFNFNVPGPLKNFMDRIGFVALDYNTLNKVGQPTGKLGNLKTFFIVTGGTPNLFRRCLFVLFPGFWLLVVTKYYGMKLGGSLYAGKLTFTHPAKDQPKLLTRAKARGRKYARKFL